MPPANGRSEGSVTDNVADVGSSKTAGTPRFDVSRVRRASEQVADQLRDLIVRGDLVPGTRLPSEFVLASEFGVSRATIRESLKTLAAQSLVRTSRGPEGGSFVTLPSVDHISEFLHRSLNILGEAGNVSLEEFLEAREILEIGGARLAARHRKQGDDALLRKIIPDHSREFSREELFAYNKGFHSLVLQMSGNTLLYIAAQPVFTILQLALSRSAVDYNFDETVRSQHHQIARAIKDRDPDAAEREMREHLEFLRPSYERAWPRAKSKRSTRVAPEQDSDMPTDGDRSD